MMYPIDLTKWRADLAVLNQEIRRLKQLLRQRWTRPMADEQRELARRKRRATELYMLRAFCRGKLHPCRPRGADERRSPEAAHRAVVERLGASYERLLEHSA